MITLQVLQFILNLCLIRNKYELKKYAKPEKGGSRRRKNRMKRTKKRMMKRTKKRMMKRTKRMMKKTKKR